MARIRNIKPDFFSDPDIAELPYQCQIFYIGLWVQADKGGRLKECARTLRSKIFPYEGVETIKKVEEFLNLLAQDKKYSNRKRPFIRRYVTDEGERMLEIVSFTEHQYLNPKERESEYPAPQKDGASRGEAEPPSTLPPSASPAAPSDDALPLSPPPNGKPAARKKKPGSEFFEAVRATWNEQARANGWVVREAALDASLERAARGRAGEFGGEEKFIEAMRTALAAFDAPWARGEGRDSDGNALPRAKLAWALRPGKLQTLLDDAKTPRRVPAAKNKDLSIA